MYTKKPNTPIQNIQCVEDSLHRMNEVIVSCIKTIPSLVTTDSYMSGHKGLIHLKINENHLKHTKTCLNQLDPETEFHSHLDTSHLETPEKLTTNYS